MFLINGAAVFIPILSIILNKKGDHKTTEFQPYGAQTHQRIPAENSFNALLRMPTARPKPSLRGAARAYPSTCKWPQPGERSREEAIKRAHMHSEILSNIPRQKLEQIYQQGLKHNFCSKPS